MSLEIETYGYGDTLPKDVSNHIDESDNYKIIDRGLAILKHNNEIISYMWEGEPEDQTFYRDLGTLLGWVEEAYRLGIQDGRKVNDES